MNDSKLVPSFRFIEFKEGYTKNKLKEMASFLKGKGYSKNDIVNYGFPIILYGRMYTNYRLNIKFINDTFVKNDKNSVKSVEGDVIIPASGETAEDISKASNIKRSGIIIGGDINIIRPDNKLIDSSFLALVLSNGKVKQKIAKRAQGKSIVHIHNTDLMSLEIYFPSLDEQKKIGNLFTKLDKLLDLQQQKIDKLELLKKALLQKLFPKHDAKIPELRFKGFEDVWRKHRLKEVSKIIGGGTPDTKNPKYWNGNINWFSPNEIGNSPYAVSSHKKITDLGLKKSSAKLHPAEKTILFTSRAGIGDMAILTTPAATNQGFQSLELNNNVDSYFVYSYGFEIKKKADRLASGSTFLEISKNEMEKITLMFPSEQEQQKIGNLLSKVDQLIELENKKLQNLQQVKKCLLQNMFVD